jgi:exonuclease SbcC
LSPLLRDGVLSRLSANKTAVCHACSQPIPPGLVAGFKDKVERLSAEAAQLLPRLQQLSRQRDQNAEAVRLYNTELHTVTTMLGKAQTTLDGLTEVAQPAELTKDEQDYLAAYRSVVAQHTDAVKRAEHVTVRLTQMSKDMGELRSNLAVVLNNVAVRTSKGEYDAAKAALATLEEVKRKVATLTGTINTLRSQQKSFLKQIAAHESDEEKQVTLQQWKTMLERLRLLLHFSSLPNLVARAHLQVLNAAIAKYLEVLHVSFVATLEPDLSTTCVFRDGKRLPAERLSTGQRAALGIAFRLAVHSLYAADLQLLVLDEPGLGFDQEHVACLIELMQQVRAYAHTAGLQLLVVTHEVQLDAAADRVINLGAA